MSKWIRKIFLITGFVNMLGALMFVPQIGFGRVLLGFPGDVYPVYLWIISSWILLFGIAYFYLAITVKVEKLFVLIGALGKILFGMCLIFYYLQGETSIWAVSSAFIDITLAVIFLYWLYQIRNS